MPVEVKYEEVKRPWIEIKITSPNYYHIRIRPNADDPERVLLWATTNSINIRIADLEEALRIIKGDT
jgi:hypothetical protein